MEPAGLLHTLRQLEVETHQSQVRADPVRLGELLHPDFFEIGRSGRSYSRSEVLAEFARQPPHYEVWSQDFRVESISDHLALLTYRSAHVVEGKTLERHTLRASLWQRREQGWCLRFHQGTPTTCFEQDAA